LRQAEGGRERLLNVKQRCVQSARKRGESHDTFRTLATHVPIPKHRQGRDSGRREKESHRALRSPPGPGRMASPTCACGANKRRGGAHWNQAGGELGHIFTTYKKNDDSKEKRENITTGPAACPGRGKSRDQGGVCLKISNLE